MFTKSRTVDYNIYIFDYTRRGKILGRPRMRLFEQLLFSETMKSLVTAMESWCVFWAAGTVFKRYLEYIYA
jgi:hypothetical protein